MKCWISTCLSHFDPSGSNLTKDPIVHACSLTWLSFITHVNNAEPLQFFIPFLFIWIHFHLSVMTVEIPAAHFYHACLHASFSFINLLMLTLCQRQKILFIFNWYYAHKEYQRKKINQHERSSRFLLRFPAQLSICTMLIFSHMKFKQHIYDLTFIFGYGGDGGGICFYIF